MCLLSGTWFAAAVAGVKKVVPEINVIGVATRHDDRVGALLPRARNASLKWSVHMGVMEVPTINEQIANLHSIGSAKESGHSASEAQDSSPESNHGPPLRGYRTHFILNYGHDQVVRARCGEWGWACWI